jgi:hypothetical protein
MNNTNWISYKDIQSESMPGVTFRISRMSLARRIDLVVRLRDLSRKIEFLQAGDSEMEQVDGNMLQRQIQLIYLEWGLLEVRGLLIDNEDATPALLIACGPDQLCEEIGNAVHDELALQAAELKN